jgi:hypothetical protein
MPWELSDDKTEISIEQSELDHLTANECPACHAIFQYGGGIRNPKKHHNTEGEYTHKTGYCVTCGIKIVIFND